MAVWTLGVAPHHCIPSATLLCVWVIRLVLPPILARGVLWSCFVVVVVVVCLSRLVVVLLLLFLTRERDRKGEGKKEKWWRISDCSGVYCVYSGA